LFYSYIKQVAFIIIIYIYNLYISHAFILGIEITKGCLNKKAEIIPDISVLDIKTYGNEAKIILREKNDESLHSDSKHENKHESYTRVMKYRSFKGLPSYSESLNFSRIDNEIDNLKDFKEVVKKLEYQAHYVFINSLFACVLFILFMSIVVFSIYKLSFKYDYVKISLDINTGLWFRHFRFDFIDIFFNLMNTCILIALFIKGWKLEYYDCIFKCTKYITNSVFVLILSGPLINVINSITYIYIYLYIYLFIYKFIYLYIYLYIYIFIYLFIYLFNILKKKKKKKKKKKNKKF